MAQTIEKKKLLVNTCSFGLFLALQPERSLYGSPKIDIMMIDLIVNCSNIHNSLEIDGLLSPSFNHSEKLD